MGLLSKLFGVKSAQPSGLTANIKNGPGTFEIDVVGESKYQRNLAKIAGNKTEDSKRVVVDALLFLEDDNPHDSNAVAVLVDDMKVGYLDRATAKSFRRQLKKVEPPGQKIEAARCAGLIVGGWRDEDSEGHFGIKLDLPLG
ncbi:MAG: HIRAN domain-containing protein [Alphaproteobacteria bacterium]